MPSPLFRTELPCVHPRHLCRVCGFIICISPFVIDRYIRNGAHTPNTSTSQSFRLRVCDLFVHSVCRFGILHSIPNRPSSSTINSASYHGQLLRCFCPHIYRHRWSHPRLRKVHIVACSSTRLCAHINNPST